MSDTTRTADELTDVWAEAAVELAEAFHPDFYEVLRVDRTGEPASWTESPWEVVEGGPCALIEGSGFGGDVADQNVIMGLSPYTAELPIDTVLTPDDRLRINGTVYLVDDVKRGGAHRMFVTASLRERRGED